MHALVTGATSGIGLEIAKLLAAMKYDLIMVGRRSERLEQIKIDMEKEYGIKVNNISCDLSNIDDVYKLIEDTKKYIDLEVVINAAGFGKVGYVTDISDKDDIGMIHTNVRALHILTKHFADFMKKGNIVNIASIAGTVPGPYMTTYGATKSYVISFGLAFGYELKKLGKDICITTACPGPVDTEFNDVAGSKYKLRSITPQKCAKDIVKAMKKKKKLLMVTPLIKILYFFSKLTPYSLLLPIEYNIQIKKNGD